MRAKAAEDRKKVLEAVQLVAQYAGRGGYFIGRSEVMTLVGAIVALVGGGHLREGGHIDSFIS